MSDLFLEEGAYYVRCNITEPAQGSFQASVAFERKQDYHDQKSLIPGVRHVIKSSFGSRKEAQEHAIAFAYKMIQEQKTGLD